MKSYEKPLFSGTDTAWNEFKYGVISGPYFPVFGLNTGKYGPEIAPYLKSFTQWDFQSFYKVQLFDNIISCENFWQYSGYNEYFSHFTRKFILTVYSEPY